MINGKKVIVVMPAYNAKTTLKSTLDEIPRNIVDEIILTDDHSTDGTAELAKRLKIKHVLEHKKNLGYGANQKTCYNRALELEADIVVMLHPDYQYTPKLIPSMVNMIAYDIYDVVLGSRILSKGALKGGMPFYKYVFNRALTFIQNILLDYKLSEYHTGFRCYKSSALRRIHYENNSNDFVFDNQLLAQMIYYGYNIGEVSCPARYDKESSSINFRRSVWYGFGVLGVSISFWLHKIRLVKSRLFTMDI
ncbi:MAG: glycosyltransferase family 2 protein [Cyclobacteriaceae bacterium]